MGVEDNFFFSHFQKKKIIMRITKRSHTPQLFGYFSCDPFYKKAMSGDDDFSLSFSTDQIMTGITKQVHTPQCLVISIIIF